MNPPARGWVSYGGNDGSDLPLNQIKHALIKLITARNESEQKRKLSVNNVWMGQKNKAQKDEKYGKKSNTNSVPARNNLTWIIVQYTVQE